MYTQVMASFCRVGLLLALVLVPLQLEAPAQAAESEAVPSDSDRKGERSVRARFTG